jgi:DNA-binding IclR family transcriptional regulator
LQRVDLRPFTRHTLTAKEKIIQEMKRIRTRGIAVDNEEMEEGVRCVAVLIFDHNNLPAASISISGAAMRVTPDRVEHFGELIKACALTISRELGFNSTH